MKLSKIIVWILLGMGSVYAADPTPLPRTIIALYDSKRFPKVHNTLLYLFAEMPLNHLGFRLEYHDIRMALPAVQHRPDVVGVITWFPAEVVVPNPRQYLQWASAAIDAGKKYVMLENPGFYAEGEDAPSLSEINQLWAKLGLRDTGRWNDRTYRTQFLQSDRRLAGFERKYTGILPMFRQFESVGPQLDAHVTTQDGHVIVATGEHGAYITTEYALYYFSNDEVERKHWYVNPFQFFRLAFDPNNVPKPDTTTLAGRRLFYSHIDGDGWNNGTLLEKYRDQEILSAEVIFRDVLKAYSDLPFTVAPIAADIDPRWFGTEKGRHIAERLFALENVEVGCHTFTHPFDWEFFENYRPEDEKPYLKLYPEGGWEQRPRLSAIAKAWETLVNRFRPEPFHYPIKNLQEGYLIPRAYALQPFSVDLEVEGAIADIDALAQAAGKKTVLYQWSGNCLPFEAMLQQVHRAGVRNLNGGITRFDYEFPSYAWVSPLGRKVGEEQQIYASNSNENTYTRMWTGKYYGFNQLPKTFKNTETPIRIRPMNLYFHMYSGERQPGLAALLGNIEYVRRQEMIPIHASLFAGMVNGFYTLEFFPEGDERWRISGRGSLQTIRMDEATLKAVDFSRSIGVIGQRHFQGSLYVYLDAAVQEPIVALRAESRFWAEPETAVPYLIDSRWPVWNLRHTEDSLTFTTQGFGEGEMRWQIPANTGIPGIATLTLSESSKPQQVTWRWKEKSKF
jgi:hypothetical protein